MYFEALCVNTARVTHVILCFDTLEPRDLRHNFGRGLGDMRGVAMPIAILAIIALGLIAPVNAYSSVAGSCEHAGVVHGIDAAPPQRGDGGYKLRIGHPGVNVPGATVPVVLTGAEPHKGFLVYAVDDDETKPLGGWDNAAMPDGCQAHPQCSHAATHDAFHNTGIVTDVLPWIAPAEASDLAKDSVIKFKVTVVRDYETWFAFEQTFVVGTEEGAGEKGLTLAEPGRAPRANGGGGGGGVRAPSKGAAVLGGWDGKSTGGDEPAPVTQPAIRPHERAIQDPLAADAVANPKTNSANDGGKAPGAARRKSGGGGRKDLTDPAGPLGERERRRAARLAHGLAMGAAWLVAAPSAAFTARHGRKKKWWFKYHRNANAGVAAATLVGAALVLDARGWSTPWGPHGKIGATVCALVAVQTLAGFWRKSFARPTWAKWHRIVGVGTWALGAYNCTTGAAMLAWMETDQAWERPTAWALLLAWIAVGAWAESRRRRRVLTLKLHRTA